MGRCGAWYVVEWPHPKVPVMPAPNPDGTPKTTRIEFRCIRPNDHGGRHVTYVGSVRVDF
jgi:hypothetical protein